MEKRESKGKVGLNAAKAARGKKIGDLRIEKTGKDSFAVAGRHYDYSFCKEDENVWLVDKFNSRIKNADAAHTSSEEFESYDDAVAYIQNEEECLDDLQTLEAAFKKYGGFDSVEVGDEGRGAFLIATQVRKGFDDEALQRVWLQKGLAKKLARLGLTQTSFSDPPCLNVEEPGLARSLYFELKNGHVELHVVLLSRTDYPAPIELASKLQKTMSESWEVLQKAIDLK